VVYYHEYVRRAFGSLRQRGDVAGFAMEVGAVFGLNNLKAIWYGQNRWRLVALYL